MEYALIAGVIYPAAYDLTKLGKMGVRSYFSNFGNYLDMIYIWASISNTSLQNLIYSQDFRCKYVMTLIYLIQIHKTFSFLRIFDSVSYLVTMLYTVFSDLKVFMLFYFILIFLFS